VLCIGSITQDHVYRLDTPLVIGEKHRARSTSDVGGGIAANAAVAISRLGGHASLAGAVGTDPLGDAVLDELRDERIDVERVLRLLATATPESIVIVEPTGARTIIARATIELTEVDAPLLHDVGFAAVLVDARWPDATRAALELAQSAEIPSVVDVDRLPQDVDMLAPATHLVFSEAALIELTGSDDHGLALGRAAERFPGRVSVTAGDRGVTWLDDGTVTHLDAFEVDAVDTTGAGDVFHGAFALALAEGDDDSDAFRFASATAALKCSRPGARAGIPNRADVEEFLSLRS
jgi:sulfofructose kinase